MRVQGPPPQDPGLMDAPETGPGSPENGEQPQSHMRLSSQGSCRVKWSEGQRAGVARPPGPLHPGAVPEVTMTIHPFTLHSFPPSSNSSLSIRCTLAHAGCRMKNEERESKVLPFVTPTHQPAQMASSPLRSGVAHPEGGACTFSELSLC